MSYLPLRMCLLVEMLHLNLAFYTAKLKQGIHIFLEQMVIFTFALVSILSHCYKCFKIYQYRVRHLHPYFNLQAVVSFSKVLRD